MLDLNCASVIQRNSGILFLWETFPFPNWTTFKTIIILVNEGEYRRI